MGLQLSRRAPKRKQMLASVDRGAEYSPRCLTTACSSARIRRKGRLFHTAPSPVNSRTGYHTRKYRPAVACAAVFIRFSQET